jgi:hypothetical protein
MEYCTGVPRNDRDSSAYSSKVRFSWSFVLIARLSVLGSYHEKYRGSILLEYNISGCPSEKYQVH